MRELTVNEVELVDGGNGNNNSGGSSSSLGTYIGAVVGAVCGVFTRGAGSASVCAVASVAVGDLIDSLPPMDPVPNPPGGGDYSNPAYKNG